MVTALYFLCNGYVFAIPADGGELNQTQYNIDYTFDETGGCTTFCLDTAISGLAVDSSGRPYVLAEWPDEYIIKRWTPGVGWEGISPLRWTSPRAENLGGLAITGGRLFHLQREHYPADRSDMLIETDLDGAVVRSLDPGIGQGAEQVQSTSFYPFDVRGDWCYYAPGTDPWPRIDRTNVVTGVTETVVPNSSDLFYFIGDFTDCAVHPKTGRIWVVDSFFATIIEMSDDGLTFRQRHDMEILSPFDGQIYSAEPQLITFDSQGTGYVYHSSSATSGLNSIFGLMCKFAEDNITASDDVWGWWDWSKPFGPLGNHNVLNVEQGLVAVPPGIPPLRVLPRNDEFESPRLKLGNEPTSVQHSRRIRHGGNTYV